MQIDVLIVIIEATGLIISSLIPTIVVGFFANRFLENKQLQRELVTLLNDLEYMNVVERILLSNSTLSKKEVRKIASENLKRDRSYNSENARIKKRIGILQNKIKNLNDVMKWD